MITSNEVTANCWRSPGGPYEMNIVHNATGEHVSGKGKIQSVLRRDLMKKLDRQVRLAEKVEKNKAAGVRPMGISEIAKKVTLKEGKTLSLSIAQVREVLACFADLQNEDDSAVDGWEKYRARRKGNKSRGKR